MKDIKELADQIGAEVWPDTVRCITDLRDFAQRLIAAYVEGQEPVAWNKKIRNSVDDLLAQAGYAKDSSARHQLSMMNFDAAPPLTEPAPSEFGTEQRDKDWSAIKDAAPTTPLHAPSEANWGEDFEHENGQYQCLCCKCGQIFIGHKRRVICKLCVGAAHMMWDKPPEEWTSLERVAAQTPEEVREIISDLLAVIETINQGHHAADHYDAIAISCAADMIERLAARVPADCVVVPREPTEAMILAGNLMQHGVRAAYKAMVAAYKGPSNE